MSSCEQAPESEDHSDCELFEDALDEISEESPTLLSTQSPDKSQDQCNTSVTEGEGLASERSNGPPEERRTTVSDGDLSDSECDDDSLDNPSDLDQTDRITGEMDGNTEDTEPALDVAEDDDEEVPEEDADKQAEAHLKTRDAELTDEQLEEFHREALTLKVSGNETFKEGEFYTAVEKYSEALLVCPLCHAKDRSILHSNRAACYLKLEKNEKAISDCTRAVDLNPLYLKPLLRRAELYEKTEKLDEALADYQRALEVDPSLGAAREACMRLPDAIKDRNEKMKEEMLSKLKDLGNMVLRPFGLSTNNFNLQQDPSTGSYSMQFQQNAQPPS